MKTIKVMGIVGIVIAVLSWIFMAVLFSTDSEAAIGWGYINLLYSLALAIVCVVQGSKNSKIIKDEEVKISKLT